MFVFDLADSPFCLDDFIYRGPAEEVKDLLTVGKDDVCHIINDIIRGRPATYIRVWTHEPQITITILFIENWIEVSYRIRWEPPKFVSEEFELTAPNSFDTLLRWLKSYKLVSESAVL